MIALVPARGGSKGLPRKNLLPLGGRPLIVHTLECARAAKRVDRIIVSTDDDEIAAVARSVPGVEVPFKRPAALSGDTASAVDVYLHAADWVEQEGGRRPNALCALLPTAPLRLASDVDACITLFEEKAADVVLSVAVAKPFVWHQRLSSDGRLGPMTGIAPSIENRQAIDRVVIPNGAVQVFDLAALARTRTYFGSNTYGFEMAAD